MKQFPIAGMKPTTDHVVEYFARLITGSLVRIMTLLMMSSVATYSMCELVELCRNLIPCLPVNLHRSPAFNNFL